MRSGVLLLLFCTIALIESVRCHGRRIEWSLGGISMKLAGRGHEMRWDVGRSEPLGSPAGFLTDSTAENGLGQVSERNYILQILFYKFMN